MLDRFSRSSPRPARPPRRTPHSCPAPLPGRALLPLSGVLAMLALAAVYTAPADAQERGGERLSPLDSVTVSLGEADLAIQYGRPSMKGREIFGALVPHDEMWRTGANEATHFRTGADLMLGETRLPAGHYTLFTIPSEDGWTLVVNGETGQWGTRHDPEHDVARLPMRVDRLEEPVETFTIRIEPTPDAESDGVLAMLWETTRAWVPLRVLEDGGY